MKCSAELEDALEPPQIGGAMAPNETGRVADHITRETGSERTKTSTKQKKRRDKTKRTLAMGTSETITIVITGKLGRSTSGKSRYKKNIPNQNKKTSTQHTQLTRK